MADVFQRCAAPPGALEQLLLLKKSIYSAWAIVKRLRKKTRWFAVFSETRQGSAAPPADFDCADENVSLVRISQWARGFPAMPLSRHISLGSGAKMPAAANEGVPTPAPSVQAGGGAI
jgi:hypothetical protein